MCQTPASYGPGGRNAQIRYSICDTRFGLLLAAGTKRGVCAIILGDSAQQLVNELQERFPAAETRMDEDFMAAWTNLLVSHLQYKTSLGSLPLDISGTAFQRQVWAALLAIPAGVTKTYGEIAQTIGCPGASQAVGQACGANPVAIVVPCHRVVRKSGDLGGYRWGIERKAALLDWERSTK